MKTLHSAQDAIEQAIEGEYLAEHNPIIPADVQFVENEAGGAIYIQTHDRPIFLSTTNYLCDPLFWQALGKARITTMDELIRVSKKNADASY